MKLKAEISQLANMFGRLNLHELLQNDLRDICVNAFKSMYEGEVVFSELMVEIGRFMRLLESVVTFSKQDSTAN